jgi:Rrf2 family cysteine metabolism transcriptional repressor
MKLNKKMQYAVLFSLYVSRAGRATVEVAADNLSLSRSFLEQVARKLRIAGVVKSVRGPNGGYELVGDPTVYDVLTAVAPVKLLGPEATDYKSGKAEERAFYRFALNLGNSIMPVLRKSISKVNDELVVSEVAAMERTGASMAAN